MSLADQPDGWSDCERPAGGAIGLAGRPMMVMLTRTLDFITRALCRSCGLVNEIYGEVR